MTRASFNVVRSVGVIPGLIACAILTSCAPDPAAELVQARAALEVGNLPEASIRVSNALQALPQNPAARVLKAQIALRSGDYATARMEFVRAEALGADRESFLTDYAQAELGMGDAGRAIDLLSGVMPEARTARQWLMLGDALVAADRLSEAAEHVARAEQEGGVATPTLLVRAKIAQLGQHMTDAAALLDRAVAAATDDASRADALEARSLLLLERAQNVAAQRDLRAAADIFKREQRATREMAVLGALVRASLSSKDLEGATTAANRLAELAPQSPASSFASAAVAYETGRFDDAIALLQHAANRVPENKSMTMLLGAAHLARGNLYQAEQRFMEVLAGAPDDPTAIQLLAETRLRQQRPEAALAALEPLSDVNPNPQLAALLGVASLQVGKIGQGVSYLEQAMAASPGNTSLRIHLARAYMTAGREADALNLIEPLIREIEGLDRDVLQSILDMHRGAAGDVRDRAASLVAAYPDNARAYLAAALYYQLAGDVSSAVDQLNTAVELDGGLLPAHVMLASLLLQGGQAQQAERHLDLALEIDQHNPKALAGKAMLEFNRGNVQAAADMLARALRSAPSAPLHLALARVRLRLGDVAAAEAETAAAAALAPNDPEVAASRGMIALAQQRWAEAVTLLSGAAGALSGRVDVALALAQAQMSSGADEAALDTLREAARVSPDSMQIRVALGQTELRLGNPDIALGIAKALQADQPRSDAGYLLEGNVRLAQRRYPAAAGSFELGFERNANLRSLSQWALALQLAGEPADAERVVSAWVSRNPEDVPGRLLLARVLQGAGRLDAAIAQYNGVLALQPDNLVALNNGAWLYQEMKRPESVELARRAYALAQDNAAVIDTLGWILIQRGETVESVGLLQKAAEMATENAEIQFHLGFALAEAGQIERARHVLKSVSRFPRGTPGRGEAEALLASL